MTAQWTSLRSCSTCKQIDSPPAPLVKMTLNKEVCIQLNILSMMWEGFAGWQGMAGVDRWNREEDLVPEEVEDTKSE